MLRLWWLHKVSAGKSFFSYNLYASSIYNDEYENLRGKIKLNPETKPSNNLILIFVFTSMKFSVNLISWTRTSD